jgi:hypothetical protein
MSEPIEIPGLNGQWRQIEARYDYENDPSIWS